MIRCASVTKSAIRNHYDLATPFYRLLWGRHIHHGLWEAGNETPEVAQQRLIDRLAGMAELRTGQAVLDVGCGMGGTSIDLARRFGCAVTGVTLSPVQRAWASWSARWQGAQRQVRFLCRDAEKLSFPPGSFDVVWSVECTEHLFDKPGFFRKAAGWLKPGGRLVISAWLAASDPRPDREALTVAEAFLCPSFGTAADYRDWFHDAGLVNRASHDLTAQVAATWDVCHQRVRKSGVGLFAWLAGRRMKAFLDHFQMLGNAYRSGAMQYGLFLAEKERS